MRVWTDSRGFAERVVGPGLGWSAAPAAGEPALAALLPRLYGTRPVHTAAFAAEPAWPHLFIVERTDQSQFDQLVTLNREGTTLPDGTLCLAGGGLGLHGQRGRPWQALAGNIHLSLWLTPPTAAVEAPLSLLAMTAVAVVETIDGIAGLADRAGIKWVNDILIDGAKVCGILTHVTRKPGGGVGIVGIGLNVEAVPDVPPTPFVPRVTALHTVAPESNARLGPVLLGLLRALARGYTELRRHGPERLAARYRARSLVVGRHVAVCADDAADPPRVVVEGRVVALGPGLELQLAGHPHPITTGRVLLRDPPAD